MAFLKFQSKLCKYRKGPKLLNFRQGMTLASLLLLTQQYISLNTVLFENGMYV